MSKYTLRQIIVTSFRVWAFMLTKIRAISSDLSLSAVFLAVAVTLVALTNKDHMRIK